jgi:hypothetical protein
MKSTAEREFLDSVREFATWTPKRARAVQSMLDDALSWGRTPVGEARELELGDLMPSEREAFGWKDTQPMDFGG